MVSVLKLDSKYIWNLFIKVGWFMDKNWLFVRVQYIVIIYYIFIDSCCQWCLDGSDSLDKQNLNK